MPVAQLRSRPRLCTRFIPGSEGAPASPLVLISTSPHIPPAEGLPPSSVSSSTDWTLGTCLPCPRLPLPATSASPSLTPGQLWARDQPPGRLRSLMQLEGCCRGFAGQRSLQGLRDSRPAILQLLQTTTVGQGSGVRTALGLDPERKLGEPKPTLGTGSGPGIQHSCGEEGPAAARGPHPHEIPSTALGKTFYYKILQVSAGLAPSLWALIPSP